MITGWARTWPPSSPQLRRDWRIHETLRKLYVLF